MQFVCLNWSLIILLGLVQNHKAKAALFHGCRWSCSKSQNESAEREKISVDWFTSLTHPFIFLLQVDLITSTHNQSKWCMQNWRLVQNFFHWKMGFFPEFLPLKNGIFSRISFIEKWDFFQNFFHCKTGNLCLVLNNHQLIINCLKTMCTPKIMPAELSIWILQRLLKTFP